MGRGILLWLLGVPLPIIIHSRCSGIERRNIASKKGREVIAQFIAAVGDAPCQCMR
jgi:hypothetical protein